MGIPWSGPPVLPRRYLAPGLLRLAEGGVGQDGNVGPESAVEAVDPVQVCTRQLDGGDRLRPQQRGLLRDRRVVDGGLLHLWPGS